MPFIPPINCLSDVPGCLGSLRKDIVWPLRNAECQVGQDVEQTMWLELAQWGKSSFVGVLASLS